MEILNLTVSAILGFISGWASSYFFWMKQRKLDKPRLELSFYDRVDKRGFYIKNKGGSFAEHPKYKYGHYHAEGEPDDFEEIGLDAALAPGDEQRIWPDLLPPRDANIEISYQDVFGKQYTDSWDVHYMREFGYEEYDCVLSKRYWPPDSKWRLFKRFLRVVQF